MYEPYFGLQREPFSIAPDPRFLFLSERHREALAHLLYGLRSGGGFVVLTGAIGAGKTTVCRALLEQVPRRCNVAYVLNPKQTATQLLATLCQEFGIPRGNARDAKGHVDALNEYLLRTHAVGQQNVLIIDEAQGLSAEVLEQLRLLTNLETNERKLLQIILIGQPELRPLLDSPALEQLAQRVIARYHLEALSGPETGQYIAHRLAVAGLNVPTPFLPSAVERIHELARGVPRRINVLCDRALLGAWSSGSTVIDVPVVEQAAREVTGQAVLPDGQRGSLRRAAVWIGLSALAGVSLGAAGVVGWQRWSAVGPTAASPAVTPLPAPGAEPQGRGAPRADSGPVGLTAGAASAPARLSSGVP